MTTHILMETFPGLTICSNMDKCVHMTPTEHSSSHIANDNSYRLNYNLGIPK